MARGKHLFPFRTEPLSPSAPMVLGPQGPGRVGRRRFLSETPLAAPAGGVFCFTAPAGGVFCFTALAGGFLRRGRGPRAPLDPTRRPRPPDPARRPRPPDPT